MLNLQNPSRDDVSAALRAYAHVTSQEAARQLMEKVGGVDALADLASSAFAAVIEAANTATANAASTGKPKAQARPMTTANFDTQAVNKIYARWNNPPKRNRGE